MKANEEMGQLVPRRSDSGGKYETKLIIKALDKRIKDVLEC